MKQLRWILLSTIVICMAATSVATDISLALLTDGQAIGDFTAEALYEDETGVAVGARFEHRPSGMVLDLMQIQSVPQAFMWFNSPPPSDQGEPHTCEHLVLGKGTKGRYAASLEEMSLGSSSAFTMQLRTCYHFHTTAGTNVFLTLMEENLDALLHPNFSDEEIRREVANMGVTESPSDGTLRLEEKGTVYAEMVSAFERPWSNLGLTMGRMMYGPEHPLGRSSGGYPPAIREMTPQDLREFHAGAYQLSNMGMIVAIPSEMSLEGFLIQMTGILERVEPHTSRGEDPTCLMDRLPEPTMAPEGEIALVSYPSQNPEEPGLLVYAWPPTRSCSVEEALLLDLFVDNLASGQVSNLYKTFIDTESRVMDLGASYVFGWMSDDLGHPIYIGLSDVRADALTETMIDSVRAVIIDEIRRIASLPDGSEELDEFNGRIRSNLVSMRRDRRVFLSSPPRFGYRGTSARWMGYLRDVNRVSGFRKSIAMTERLNWVDSLLSTGTNPWADYLSRWDLLDTPPYAVAARGDKELLAAMEERRRSRIDAFADSLQDVYGTGDRLAAIRQYRDEYDANTAIIDAAARTIEIPRFIDTPPMTLDEQLQYRVDTLAGSVPVVTSTFENMTGATAGLAFRLDVVPQEKLLYLAALPSMMTQVGIVTDSGSIPFDKMQQQLRDQIRSLNTYYSSDPGTERVELVVRGAGTSHAEDVRALEWMEHAMFSVDWRQENLPRIRDVVDQALSGARNRMRGSEEGWVYEPAYGYWRQENPLFLTTECFLTQAHALQRLRWRLKSASAETTDEFMSFMTRTARAAITASRETIEDVLDIMAGDTTSVDFDKPGRRSQADDVAGLSDEAAALLAEAVRDLRANLPLIPDNSLIEDWRYLCMHMARDLAVDPRVVLDDYREVLSAILHQDNARAFLIGRQSETVALREALTGLVEQLDAAPSVKQPYDRVTTVTGRIQRRYNTTRVPVYVGLINENTRSGVFINSAPLASYRRQDRDRLLDFLTSRLYGGGGAHSMFMKTWGAGLAYSNGLRADVRLGRLDYYAERCPDLAQTMNFVVDQIKTAEYDPGLAEYAVAQAFSASRAGSRYEQRGEAMAADLADGVTPQAVRSFREAIVELRQMPGLADTLWSRMYDLYGRVLPGLGPSSAEVPSGTFFMIGPVAQMESFGEYLNSVEPDEQIYHMYPRDYWLTD